MLTPSLSQAPTPQTMSHFWTEIPVVEEDSVPAKGGLLAKMVRRVTHANLVRLWARMHCVMVSIKTVTDGSMKPLALLP